MGFEQNYTRRLNRGSNSYKGKKSSILPFFGFSYFTEDIPYTQTVWVEDRKSRTGKSSISRTEYDKEEGFERLHTPPEKMAELEDRFLALKNGTNPLDMPYIPLSVKEYYEQSRFPGETEAGTGCVVGCLPGILWLILYSHTYPLVIRWFGEAEWNSALFVFGFPIGFCLVSGLIGGIVQIFRRIKYGKRPDYCDLPEEKKKKLREDYLAYMKKKYGEKAGAVLQEYAILKEYDHI